VERAASQTSLLELAALFLRLGITAFGGPAAHIAMMQHEVVVRRRWMSDAEFLDLLGATNLIPGPNSTEMAIFIGWSRRRWAGLGVAGVGFILPAMALTAILGWVYVRFGALPSADSVLYGVKPVMIAIIAHAIVGLAPRAARTPELKLLGAAAAVLAGLGVHELLVLFGAGALFCARGLSRGSGTRAAPLVAFGPLLSSAAGGAASSVTLAGIGWVFLKIGSVLFGSGYVLLAFLRAELVERRGWLSEPVLLDALAIGQVTPGPVFTTATFIGYLLAGLPGALVATLGIFAPAFVFVALSALVLPHLRASRVASLFLDGVNVAALALMVVVTVQLGVAVLVDVPAALIAMASAIALVRYRLNATWLVLGGALAGWALRASGLSG
jgi:chromate transporter